MRIPRTPTSGSVHRRGFTLPETIVCAALLALTFLGLTYSHIVGLKMYNITAAKLGASHCARAALGRVRDEIRSGKYFYVGNGNAAGFIRILNGSPRQGNALQVFRSAHSTNDFVRFFVDTESQELKRLDGLSGAVEVVSPYVTNQVAFAAEDCLGNILTTDRNNRVVRMDLDFCRWEFPVAEAGAGGLYDYYHLQTKIARRSIE